MGGQLGSTLLALRLYSSTAKISLPQICGFWGVRAGAKIRGALQLGSSAQSFPRTRPICAVFPGLKVLSEENLVKWVY